MSSLVGPTAERLPPQVAMSILPKFWHIVYTQFRNSNESKRQSVKDSQNLMLNK